MTAPITPRDALVANLNELLQHATTIWNRYQQDGPGRVPPELFDKVDVAAQHLEQLFANPQTRDAIPAAGVDAGQTQKMIRQTTELTRRCACTPHGLSFISGEAGLIPRRDQHQALEQAIRELGESMGKLRGTRQE